MFRGNHHFELEPMYLLTIVQNFMIENRKKEFKSISTDRLIPVNPEKKKTEQNMLYHYVWKF